MDIKEFIENGVSPFHVVKESEEWLKEENFQKLELNEDWNIVAGQGYYVKPYPSSLFAFRPNDDTVRIITGHTDQPMLKMKPNPVIARENYYVVNVEKYGGMILHTWFDRPLALAGKVVCKSEDVFHPNVFLYDSKEPIAVIPSLAIHMDREVNQKNELKCQVHLLPLCGLQMEQESVKDPLLCYVAKQLDVNEEDVLDADLYFYNPQKPQLVGLQKELIVSPRLDNLTSCYSALYAISEHTSNHTAVVALFDNEEIGSRTKQGADSNILSIVLMKLMMAMNAAGITKNVSVENVISSGFVMSLDVAHAYHPNYASKSDLTTITRMGKGIVIKTSGSQRYNSDSTSTAAIIQLCQKHQIAYQRQINHSDIAGGSTLGPIVSAYLPTYGIDAGVGILAMHSAVETAAISDCEMLNQLATRFLNEE